MIAAACNEVFKALIVYVIFSASKHRLDPESPPKSAKRTALTRTSTLAEVQASEKIKDLENKLALEKKKSTSNVASNSTQGLTSQASKQISFPLILSARINSDWSTEKPRLPRPPKGASLANPNKKARKYQAIEFESDGE